MTLTQVTTGGVDENINIDSNTLKVDGTNNRVGIGTAAPSAMLHVNGGAASASPHLRISADRGLIARLGDTSGAAQSLFDLYDTDGSTQIVKFISGSGADFINTGGDFGIGTSSPSFSTFGSNTGGIHIKDVGNSNSGIKIEQGSNHLHLVTSGSQNFIHSGSSIPLAFSTNGSERMRIDSSGNVGIGNTIPGSFQAGGRNLVVGDNSAEHGITIYSTTSGNIYFGDGTGGSAKAEGYIQYLHNTNRLDFGTSNSTRMTIDSSGNIGIGTTSPGNPLHIANQNPSIRLQSNSGSYQGRNTLGQFNNILYLECDNDNAVANSAIAFTVDASEKMRIDSSGKVGIGVSSPAATLHLSDSNHGIAAGYVGGTLPNSAGIYTSSSTTHGQAYGSLIVQARADYSGYGIAFRASNAERMRVHPSGHIFFNGMTSLTASSTNKGVVCEEFSTHGRVNIHAKTNAGNQVAIGFYHSGSNVGGIYYTSSATTYSTSSDYRLKENVVDLDGAIDRVKELLPKRFNFIVDADTTVDGFLAHEAQTVVPEAVTGTHNEVDNDGNAVMQSIDQSKLVPLLTAALQEAIAKIETLETKVAALEAAG